MDDVTFDRALIFGCLQAGPKALFKARESGIRAEHFLDEDRPIWEFMETFSRKGRLPSPEEIAAATGVSLEIPEKPYDAETFAKPIAKRALQNMMSSRFGDIGKLMVVDPFAAREQMAELVRDTSWSTGRMASYIDPETFRVLIDDYEKMERGGGVITGLSSPWPNVDKHSLGLQPGELTVLLAKRKTGKSWGLLAWFMHILKNDLAGTDDCLLIVSMEMPAKQMYKRLAAIDLNLDYADFRAGRLTVDERKRLYDKMTELENPQPGTPTIHIATAKEIKNVADICGKVSEKRPRAVGIDGMYILGRDKKLGMWERTITNCSEIKLDLCEDMDIGVLATSQFAGTKDKQALEATADDAAYAKAIGDWADAMRGLFMNDEYERAGQRVFRAMESREFQGVDLDINFNLKLMDFSEIKVRDDDAGDGDKPGDGGEDGKAGGEDAEPVIDGSGGGVDEKLVVAVETETVEDAGADEPENAPGAAPGADPGEVIEF